MKIINWLTVPTAIANLTNAIGGLFFPVNFYAVLEVTRIVGHRHHRDLTSVAVVAVSPRRPRSTDRYRARDARRGALRARGAALVLHLAAGGAVRAGAEQAGDRRDRGFSTWIMVIFKPDGSHGMYSWLHVGLATACAAAAWYSLVKSPEPEPDRRRRRTRRTRLSRPSPAPGAPPRGPGVSAARPPVARWAGPPCHRRG